MLSFVNFGTVVLEKRILSIFTCRYHLPLEVGLVIHLYKFKFSLPKNALFKFWLKLVDSGDKNSWKLSLYFTSHFLALEDGVVVRFHKLPASTATCMWKKSLKLLQNNVFDLIKVALYTTGSQIYYPTSQYGDLNILWNCLYRSTFFYIIIAQWSRALDLRTADPEFKSDWDFC